MKRDDNSIHQLAIDGVFIQIGLVPNSEFLGNLMKKIISGEIIINDKCETSASGIYAQGDGQPHPISKSLLPYGYSKDC